jgi:hypothetical protein
MAAERSNLKIFRGRTLLGTVVRGAPGHVYAYAGGIPLGSYADVDAAVRALENRKDAA